MHSIPPPSSKAVTHPPQAGAPLLREAQGLLLERIYRCKPQDVTSQKGHISSTQKHFHGAIYFPGFIFVLLLLQNILAHFGANCKTRLIAVHIAHYY